MSIGTKGVKKGAAGTHKRVCVSPLFCCVFQLFITALRHRELTVRHNLHFFNEYTRYLLLKTLTKVCRD